jgi:MerR family transcriptional regulator, light-induced transcriptional regulator
MDILSTRSVAEVLGVSEATVKRWADAGTLRCFKTPGGHRKFRLRDVKAFLADQQDGPIEEPAPSPPSSSELSPEQLEARALALAADVDALVSLVANQRLKGLTLAHTFDKVIAPALHDIGAGWAEGRVSPAQEHIASNTVVEMLARVRPLVERTSRTDRGRAICACLGNEYHDIPVRMVGLILACEGYRTVMVGANVPAGDLALMIAGDPPAVLALSASGCADSENLRGDLAVLASAAAAVRTRVICGGAGFVSLATLPASVTRYTSLEELAGVTLS